MEGKGSALISFRIKIDKFFFGGDVGQGGPEVSSISFGIKYR